VSVAYGGVVVCRDGVASAHDADKVRAHLAGRMVEVTADLGLGDGTAAILTTDLSPAYIAENMRTS
jgi:glutamate N-acetyltransferase/amino-acid N-acetyltransferase